MSLGESWLGFLEEVGRQWSERCVWTFSLGSFCFDLRSQGCPLKMGFRGWRAAGGLLSSHVTIHHSPSHVLPTPRWKFCNLLGWFMDTEHDRYILGLCLGPLDILPAVSVNPHKHLGLLIETMSADHPRGHPNTMNHLQMNRCALYTEGLCGQRQKKKKKATLSTFPWWVGCYFCDFCKPFKQCFPPWRPTPTSPHLSYTLAGNN